MTTGSDGAMRWLRGDERGQVLPHVPALVVVILVVGALVFQVGRASTFRAEAVTAADAAALAAAAELRDQLTSLDLRPPNDRAIEAAAAEYAARNGATLVGYERVDIFDVRVIVRANTASDDSGALDAGGGKAEARARAHVDFAVFGGGIGGGGVPTGNLNGNVQDAIRLAQSMGLVVTSTTGGRHAPGSYHYSGNAADVAGPPARMAAFYRAALARYSSIAELFYDPIGGIKHNQQIGPIGGHSDHVHIALLGTEIGEPPGDAPPDPTGEDTTTGPGRGPSFPLVEIPVTLVPYE